MSRLEIISNDVTGSTHTDADLSVVTWWKDERLTNAAINPCASPEVMSDVISLPKEEAKMAGRVAAASSRFEKFFMPSLDLLESDKSAPSILGERAFHLGNQDNNMTSVLHVERTIRASQAQFDLTFYPFDSQVARFVLPLTTEGTTLVNCSTAFTLAPGALKSSGEWTITKVASFWSDKYSNGDGTGSVNILDEVLTSLGPRESAAATAADDASGFACVVEVHVERNPNGFVISNMVPTFLVVFGGLGALWVIATDCH